MTVLLPGMETSVRLDARDIGDNIVGIQTQPLSLSTEQGLRAQGITLSGATETFHPARRVGNYRSPILQNGQNAQTDTLTVSSNSEVLDTHTIVTVAGELNITLLLDGQPINEWMLPTDTTLSGVLLPELLITLTDSLGNGIPGHPIELSDMDGLMNVHDSTSGM
jgi:hypothetical protein